MKRAIFGSRMPVRKPVALDKTGCSVTYAQFTYLAHWVVAPADHRT